MQRLVLTTIFVAALGTLPAAAQEPRFSAAFNIGGDISVGGTVHGAGSGVLSGLPASVDERSYGDIYGSPFTWSLDFGFAATPRDEVRVRLIRSSADTEEQQVGVVDGLGLFAQYDDYSTFGMDFGYRRYFALPDSPLRPYAGASFGFLNVNEIDATFTVPLAAVLLPQVPMYQDSTVATISFGGGALFPLTPRFAIQAGVEFRWHGALEPIDGLAGSGLEDINDDSSRWSFPITAGAVVRF